jgi:hypothetical protein
MECVDDVESMPFTSRRDDAQPAVLGKQVNVDSIPGLNSNKSYEKDVKFFYYEINSELLSLFLNFHLECS